MNYVGFGRTNYVQVKDPERFEHDMQLLGLRPLKKKTDGGVFFALFPYSEDGSLPSQDFRVDAPEDEDAPEFDCLTAIADYLADGQVLVFMQVGYGGSRYLTGEAFAIDNTGKQIQISLQDIYKQAREHFGVEPLLAEY